MNVETMRAIIFGHCHTWGLTARIKWVGRAFRVGRNHANRQLFIEEGTGRKCSKRYVASVDECMQYFLSL